MSLRRALVGLALLLGLAAAVAWGLLAWQTRQREAPPAAAAAADPARGAYLARVGNCAGCHTARGGAPLAGGRGIPTPFGTVFSSNISPDPATGLGRWSRDDFWRALHHGVTPDGRLLTPAFPYINTSLISRADADDLHAWLMAQPAVREPRREHELRWPFSTQWALAVWRTLFFRPAEFRAQPEQDAAWNRGAYLVQGLAHCSACHGTRNALGAAGADNFSGGMLVGLGWQAPSLHDPHEAGVQDWPDATLRRWLRDGHAEDNGSSHAALGPMGEVILGSTAALDDADLAAVSVYLRGLPRLAVSRAAGAPPDPQRRELGASLYREHCASCHGAQGEGGRTAAGEPAYPALAGNRTVNLASAANLLRVIERGAFAPATAGHARPFGMPPFAGTLNAEALAALASHLRTSFGNQAGELDAVTVLRHREATGAR